MQRVGTLQVQRRQIGEATKKGSYIIVTALFIYWCEKGDLNPHG